MPSAPGAAQGNPLSVPSAPYGPQGGAPGVPSAPGAHHMGGQALGRARQALWGTVRARIITTVIALAVIGTSAGVVTIAVKSSSGQNPLTLTNTASFTVMADIHTVDGLNHPREIKETLIVRNGTVCQAQDTGKQRTVSGGFEEFTFGVPYQEKVTTKCQGTYQDGKLSYTQTALYLENDFKKGFITYTCHADVPLVLQQLTGSLTSSTAISGSFQADASSYGCQLGYAAHFPVKNGTWTGTVQQAAGG